MITISSSVLDFGEVSKNQSVSKQITVFSTEATSTEVSISSSSVDYEVAPESLTIDAYGSKSFTIEYTANNIANVSGQITVSSLVDVDRICDVSAVMLTPNINLSTSSLDFGQVGIDDSKKLSITIENTSTDATLIVEAVIDPAYSSYFSFLNYMELQPLETKVFDVTFSANSEITIAEDLTLTANTTTGTYLISIDAEGVYPTVTVDPTNVDFGTSVVINDSATVNVDITNDHTEARVLISSIVSNHSFLVATSSADVIDPGETEQVSITFKPLTQQPISSSVEVFLNIASSPSVITVTGTGLLSANLMLSKSTLDYDIYPLANDIVETVLINNTGIIDLHITNIVAPTISDTTINLSRSTPITVPARSSVSLDVTLNSTDNVTFSENLEIESDSVNSPHNLLLTGEGQSPEIKINIDELDFGTIYVEASKAIQFTVFNNKDVTLYVSITETDHVTISGPNFQVNPHSSITLSAIFSLNTTGEVSETLVINSNDINNPTVNISVIGKAVELELPQITEPILSAIDPNNPGDPVTVTLPPAPILFSIDENKAGIEFFHVIPEFILSNYMSVDVPTNVELTLINRSFSNASLDSLSVTNSNDATATYTITTQDLPIELEPGESSILNIELTASTFGVLSGYLKFAARVGENLETDIDVTVRYQGEAFSPDIELSTSSISFPDTVVGETEYSSFTIKNNSVGAELVVSISSDNDVFNFRGKGFINATASGSKINLSESEIILQSVTITDNLTGTSLALGDPSTNVNQFSVNTSTGVITVNSVQNGKSFQIFYDYKQSEISLTIGKLAEKDIEIAYSPKDTSSQSGIITINSNDDSNPTLTIDVDGTGLTAVTSIDLAHDVLIFESKVNQSVVQKCVLKNTGTVKLFVSNIDSSNALFTVHPQVQQLLDSGLGFNIDPNETFDLPIVFSPVDDSTVTTNITIDSNAPDLIIPIEGQGLQPELSVTSAIDFEDTAIDFSKDIILTVNNTGSAQLNVQLDVVSDFFFISPSVFAVEPNDSYDCVVSFKPKETISYSATVKVTTDDPDNEESTISLSGVGVLKPVIEVSRKLEFTKTNVREASQITLVVSNVGSEALSLSSLSVTDNSREFSVSFTPTSVQPLTSRNYIVKFVPIKSGNTTGKITVTSDDVDNPSIEILLKGVGFQPDGEWQSFNLQDLMPDPVISLANGVNNFISPVKTILGLIKSILSLVKIFLVDSSSALTAILEKVQNIINDYVNDLTSSGIYILPIYPRSNYYDPNVIAENGFSKFLASIGGGSEAFKRRIANSFDDIYDGNRPQFSSSAKVGAFVIAVDSGNLTDVIAGIQSLQNIFSATSFEPEIQAPTTVEAVGDNNLITLRWQLPEIVTFNVFGIFSERKVLEFISGFNVYRSDLPGQLRIAIEDDKENGVEKGDVIDADSKKVNPINNSPISSSNYSQLLKNFKGSSNSATIQNIGFQHPDSDVENGKTYYYVVRTVMSGKTMSPLSAEASGTPIKNEPLKENSFLNRCANFSCFADNDLIQKIEVLSKPVIKLIDKTGQIQQTTSRTERDKLTPNAGLQQVNTFIIKIRDTDINGSTISIRNTTVTEERISANSLEIDVSRFYNKSNKTVKDWDNINTDWDEEKKSYFEIINNTKLILGYDFTIVKDRENTIITINDISGIGYKQSDNIIIEYSSKLYKPSCLYFKEVGSSGNFDNRFDSVKCLNGTNKGICEKYVNKRCQYHGGTGCFNAGFTYKGENRCVPNSTLFNAVFCQNGSIGGNVSFFDKSLRNDPNSCIKTTGVCAGYTSIDEDTVGAFPNWSSFTVKALIKPIEDFIDSLNQWVNREIDAVQKGSSTVADFIDLLGKKIEALEEFIDKLQEIIDIFTSIFSANAGFHILRIDAGTGGSERIKSMITTAKGGPDSGSDGFTAGIVILIGGPDFDKTWQFLKQIF